MLSPGEIEASRTEDPAPPGRYHRHAATATWRAKLEIRKPKFGDWQTASFECPSFEFRQKAAGLP